jgi:hypothetical protein
MRSENIVFARHGPAKRLNARDLGIAQDAAVTDMEDDGATFDVMWRSRQSGSDNSTLNNHQVCGTDSEIAFKPVHEASLVCCFHPY